MQCIEFIASCFTRSPPKTTNKAELSQAKRDAPEGERKRERWEERESCLCREFVAIMPFDIIHNCNQLGNCLADATVPAASSLLGHHQRRRRRGSSGCAQSLGQLPVVASLVVVVVVAGCLAAFVCCYHQFMRSFHKRQQRKLFDLVEVPLRAAHPHPPPSSSSSLLPLLTSWHC